MKRILSFEQREGLEPLPQMLKRDEVSPQLRSLVWAVLNQWLEKTSSTRDVGYFGREAIVSGYFRSALAWYHINRLYRPADEFDIALDKQKAVLKKIIFAASYGEFYGFIEFIIGYQQCPKGFVDDIQRSFKEALAPYAIVDGNKLAPISNSDEAATIGEAFVALKEADMGGAATHLRQAVQKLNQREYAASIRESISAVESVARTLAPKSTTLGPALSALEKSGLLHPVLKSALDKMYGYTNSEEGIRHALLDDAVSSADVVHAQFMLGACASFVSYLINQGRASGLIKTLI
jgi:hypothetical protein